MPGQARPIGFRQFRAVITINLLAVAGALLGLGWGAALRGLVSRRFSWACVIGSRLPGIAASPMVSEIHGSPVLGIGMIVYLCWLVFLFVASKRLLRTSVTEAPAQLMSRCSPASSALA